MTTDEEILKEYKKIAIEYARVDCGQKYPPTQFKEIEEDMPLRTIAIRLYREAFSQGQKASAKTSDELLKKYVEIRDNSQKRAVDAWAKLPSLLKRVLDRSMGYYDIMEIDMKGSDLENFMLYSRFNGIENFLSLQLLQDLASRKIPLGTNLITDAALEEKIANDIQLYAETEEIRK